MKVTCHPRLWVASDTANGPVDLCSAQPAAAGRRGSPEYLSTTIPMDDIKNAAPNEAAKLSNNSEFTKLYPLIYGGLERY